MRSYSYPINNVVEATGEQKLIAAILKQAVVDFIALESGAVTKLWSKRGKQLSYEPRLDLYVFFRSQEFQNYLAALGYDKQYFLDTMATVLEQSRQPVQ